MEERLPLIVDPRSERMRTISSLGRRSFRARKALLRVEGPQAVRELVSCKEERVRGLYATEAAAVRNANTWQRFAGARYLLDDRVARAVAPESQGFIAVAERAAIGGELEGQGPVVLLPGTQDPGNAGTIIRNADAFGAAGVIACVGTVDLTSPKVIRMSAGSIFHLPVQTGVDFDEALRSMRESGRVILGADGDGAPVSQMGDQLSGPQAWVFGNEAAGLTPPEAKACDHLVSVPMSGAAESLNVGVAAGICLFLSQQARGRMNS